MLILQNNLGQNNLKNKSNYSNVIPRNIEDAPPIEASRLFMVIGGIDSESIGIYDQVQEIPTFRFASVGTTECAEYFTKILTQRIEIRSGESLPGKLHKIFLFSIQWDFISVGNNT